VCGIAGIVDLRARRPIDTKLLERMNRSLEHRGPDGEGFHIEPGVGFGHRRLSIIDLEGGKQPMYNEDGTVVVTYNGEIYNFKEIEVDLRARGHVFRTRCDSEVIVHAWEEWGERCLDRFNGMFAFALWDRNRETLFLARDRIGVKPLYYTALADGRLMFASELKALMLSPDVSRRVDPTAVEDYFAFGYVPDPKSIFVGVHKLEPGYCIAFRRGSAAGAPQRYWDVPLFGDVDRVTDDSPAVVASALKDAVARRLVADVPLGAFLSGGIDSSAVVAMMDGIGVEHLLTCFIGFNETEYDESRYARLVAQQKGTDHRVEVVEASDYGLLDRLASLFDEPFFDSSAIPTYRVCQLARRHVTVALSGDGGDENFLGYRRYKLFRGQERVRTLLSLGLRRPAAALERYFGQVTISSRADRAGLFSKAFANDLQGYDAAQVFVGHLQGREFADPLRMIQYLDFKTYLPGDILTKVDRASMAHGLEVRVPFLDYRFVERIAALPSEFKLKGDESKYGLKKALEPYLPHEVIYRRKMGFSVPLKAWLRGSLAQYLADVINGERLRDCGLFEPKRLATLVDEQRTRKPNHSALLWSLLMFDGFLRNQS
jgi:asparagine synthase (glutamine-hydrolysing)